MTKPRVDERPTSTTIRPATPRTCTYPAAAHQNSTLPNTSTLEQGADNSSSRPGPSQAQARPHPDKPEAIPRTPHRLRLVTEAAAEVPPPGRIGRDAHPRRTLGFSLAIGGALLFAVNGSVSKITLESGSTHSAWCCCVALEQLRASSRSSSSPIGVGCAYAEPSSPALVYGLVGIAMVQWLYFVAIARLPVGVALLLEFTGPVLVALWARFVQKQQLGRSLWLALALALGGLALVAEIWDGLSFDTVGVLAASALRSHSPPTTSPANTPWSPVTPFRSRSGPSWSLPLFWSVAKPWWTVPWDTLNASVELPGALDGTSVTGWALIPGSFCSERWRRS